MMKLLFSVNTMTCGPKKKTVGLICATLHKCRILLNSMGLILCVSAQRFEERLLKLDQYFKINSWPMAMLSCSYLK